MKHEVVPRLLKQIVIFRDTSLRILSRVEFVHDERQSRVFGHRHFVRRRRHMSSRLPVSTCWRAGCRRPRIEMQQSPILIALGHASKPHQDPLPRQYTRGTRYRDLLLIKNNPKPKRLSRTTQAQRRIACSGNSLRRGRSQPFPAVSIGSDQERWRRQLKLVDEWERRGEAANAGRCEAGIGQ